MDWKLVCQDVRYEEPMSRHTSLGIGGPAEVLLRPHTRDELKRILREDPDAFVFGNGTNLLVSDAGLRGVAVSTMAIRELIRLDDTHIRCESGALLPQVSSFAWKLGLSGLEFAAGIPGTVGGALCMNAGAYDGEISQVTTSSDCLSADGENTLEDHGFGYRDSVYKRNPGLIALSAVFALRPDDRDAIRAKMDDYSSRRREKQPLEWPSAGSVFKRPPGQFAGSLIEQCGLKGFAIGGAQVSEKHAGFIVNRGGATCEDVLRLIAHIQETVLKNTGVSLEPELRTVGI